MKNYLQILILAFLVLFIPESAWAVALADSKVQYVGTVEFGNVAAYPAGTGTNVNAGTLTTNTANGPALGNERVFVSYVTGTTSGTEPTFGTTRGVEATDNTIKWIEVSGQPCVNGDTTNATQWGASLTAIQGQTIYDPNTLSCQVVTTAGTTKALPAPSFSATAGTTTTDNTVTWTSLGLASHYGAWAAPHKRLLNADAATWETVVPATIFISSTTSESQNVGMAIAGGQGSAANPNRYISVSSATAPPTSATAGASLATTNINTFTVTGFGYYYGITFSNGSGNNSHTFGLSSTATSLNATFDTCTFSEATTSGTSLIALGATGAQGGAYYINSKFTFGATGQIIAQSGGNNYIIGGSMAATGSIPTTLFKANIAGTLVVRDVDISQVTGTLYSANGIAASSSLIIENCKIGSGVTMTSGSFILNAGSFRMHNCDSGSKNYRFYEGNYLGTLQSETTIVDNTNKATDGTTQVSWNMASTANSSFAEPYSVELTPFHIWENTTGSSVTATIHIAGANTLTNGDIWPECEYEGSSSFPIATRISGRVADAVTAVSNWATSTDSWGGSPAHVQDMALTFTPQLAGLIRCRVYMAKASTTEYISPAPTVTGLGISRSYLAPGEGYINESPATTGYAF